MSPSRSPAEAASAAARSRTAGNSVFPRIPEQLHEARKVQSVFLDLSARYEDYCRRTGASESRALCDAASRFRRERSLASLLAFADCLEELDIPGLPGGSRRRTWRS